MPVRGERIRQVRRLRRLNQRKFGELIGLQQGAISQYEAGLIHPSTQSLQSIAVATGFPVEFFSRPSIPELPLGSLAFRGRKSTLRTQQNLSEAHAWAELVFECAVSLLSRVDLPAIHVPTLPNVASGDAAQITRSALGLTPHRPVPNVIHALESAGVLVLALPAPLPGRDAFSAWVSTSDGSRIPVIFVPTGGSGDRIRFTVSHELGHLVGHPNYRGYIREAEEGADQFASEFLLPESGIRDELKSPISIPYLGALKMRWGASIQALIIRAGDLGVISKRRVQQLFQFMSAEGLRTKEPAEFDIPVEKPRSLRKMLEIVYGNPIDRMRLANDFNLPLTLAQAILDSHADRTELFTTVASDGTAKIVRLGESRE